MKALVTGSSGYVASWLVPELKEHRYEVWGVDVEPAPQSHRLDKVIHANLAQPGKFEEVFNWSTPDIVIHLAALYGRVQGERAPFSTVSVNTALTTEIAQVCGRHSTSLIYVSSSEIYGGNRGWESAPIEVDDPKIPRNLYGWSKLWGEQAVEHYCFPHASIVRLNMPYGPNGKVAAIGYNALHTWLWQAHHGLPMTVHDRTWRTYTWAGDTVRAIRMIMESGRPQGYWNVCRDDDLRSSLEVARLALEVAGVKDQNQIKLVKAPPDVTPSKRLDNERLLSIGWAPTVELEEGARLTLPWVQKFDAVGQ